MMRLLDNPIAILFLSFIVGLMIDLLLRRVTNYEALSSRYLFAKSKTYESLGVLWFRKLLLATPLRFFNTKIYLTKNRDLVTLKEIRDHMAAAEVSHWVGFAAMLGVTVVAWWYHGSKIGMAHIALNILGNLYPCMLQQYNKRRLLQVIALLEKRNAPVRELSRS